MKKCQGHLNPSYRFPRQRCWHNWHRDGESRFSTLLATPDTTVLLLYLWDVALVVYNGLCIDVALTC